MKNLITENQIFGLKIIILLLKLIKEITKIMIQTMKQKREDMFKNHNFKIFQCNPNDPNFDLFKFLGEINFCLSKLREKHVVNGVISKVTDDFKNSCSDKIKRIKKSC